MTTLFLTVAEQSLRLSGIILCLWGLRAIFRKIPAPPGIFSGFSYLWGFCSPCGWRFPITRKPRSFPPPPWFPPRMQALCPDDPSVTAPPPASQTEPAAPQNPRVGPALVSLAAIIWAAVAVVLVGINGWKLAAFARRLSGAREISPGVYETDRTEVPLVMGYLHPHIYLPSFLREEEREYILLHEQIHLRRRDYLIKPAVFVITLLHWFNPLAWLGVPSLFRRYGTGL